MTTSPLLPNRPRDRYARELLMDGRVMIFAVVAGVLVDAEVRIAGRVCRVAWSPDRGWSCTCAAVGGRCPHTKAVQLVVVVDVDGDDDGS